MILIQDLTKSYGDRRAVDELNLSVAQGEIFGFVGPNGAGKTSTIRMIAGLLQPDYGQIWIAGQTVSSSSSETKRLIGYMPDEFGVYPDLKVWEYLDFFSACYDIPEKDRPILFDGLLELVDLQHRRDDWVDRLSRGMKQRLSLARTLIHNPQLLILDEPAADLDPRARMEIRELLVELARMGKTVFFSSHILADVAEICTRVGIIEAGRLVAVGGLEELHLQVVPHRKINIVLLNRLPEARAVLEENPAVNAIYVKSDRGDERISLEIEFTGNDLELSSLLSEMVRENIQVLHFSEDHRDLEEIFLRATRGLVT